MKKMMAFAAVMLLASCSDITYDPETRFALKSHLTDADGNPAVNVRAELSVREEDDYDLLSVAYSNQNGDVMMVFPKAENNARYSIEYGRVGSEYESVSLRNITRAMFEDNYTLSIQKTLDLAGSTVALHLYYVQTNLGQELVSANVTGILGSQDVNYAESPEELQEEVVKVYKNQIVTLHYSLRDYSTNVVTDYETQIEIGQANVDFTLEY